MRTYKVTLKPVIDPQSDTTEYHVYFEDVLFAVLHDFCENRITFENTAKELIIDVRMKILCEAWSRWVAQGSWSDCTFDLAL